MLGKFNQRQTSRSHMANFILRVLITALAILVTAKILPGIVVSNFGAAIIAAFLLGIVNATLKPILVILTLPITILTLGLFYFIINAFFFSFVAGLVSGFEIESFGSAILGSIIVSVITAVAAPKK